MRICFLGSNHTTGGNSGSPVINGEGHLVGINFDRSWESTMSDLMFDGEICRNIMVDIKFVLWVMDKYAGAKHLVDEMTLVDAEWRINQEELGVKTHLNQYTNRLRDVPSDLYALLGRAEIYLNLGQNDKAIEDMNKAIELHPKNTSALNMRGAFFAKIGRQREAMADVQASLKIDKNNLEGYFVRGLIYADLGKYEEAIKDFDKVIQMDYTFYKAYYDRGVCYEGLGEVDEACKNFEIAKLMGDKKAAEMYHVGCEFGAW